MEVVGEIKDMKNKSKQTKAPRRLAPMVRKPTVLGNIGKMFGAVSTINTAPVAIGNSLTGSKPKVLQTVNGARVLGRDFAFAASSTVAAVNDWELIGGMPLTPAVLVSSVLRNFSQIYNKFKIAHLTVHYVTSSSTSQPGDVLFYYEKNRNSPAPDYSNSAFLNFVMSDPNTVIGPQWTNHSMTIKPVAEWKTTSFGATVDTDDDNQGSIYFFSKTNTTNSPGYILIDYDISFAELSVNPRAGVLPITRGLFNQICLSATNLTVTPTTTFNLSMTTGNILNGAVSTLPPGCLNGDIYKCVFNLSASTKTGVNPTWTPSTVNASTLLRNQDDIDSPITVDDGFTCYLVIADINLNQDNTATGALFSTLEQAVTRSRGFVWGMQPVPPATTITVTSFNLVCTVSLIGSTNAKLLQQTY